MDSYNIVFRADASRETGSGHIKRTLIIADELSNDTSLNISFICIDLADLYKKEIIEKGYKIFEISKINEADQVINILKKIGADVLISDTDVPLYYEEDFQKKVTSICKLVSITFYSNQKFYSHIIHNQNIRAKSLQYDCMSYTIKLLGLNYLILNQDFREIEKVKKNENQNNLTILLSFGGADSRNFTVKSLKAIHSLKDIINELIIVVGGLYDNFEELKGLIQQSDINISLYKNTPKMAELMANSDIAITSGGLTSWELASLNVNNIIIPTSERESVTAKYLEEKFKLWCIFNESNINYKLPKLIEKCYDDRSNLENPLRNEVNKDGVELFCNEIKKLLKIS
ncbi:MAG: UDP-2,4-diacetamido-2,4,6-trideoxy-beta-L-altropyranose hydrolase [Bacteroidetes bacterium]|nr:MAG: UDP-2,4-diacetamido-2,4,6-trideoxy-beta-L-altropyranose hydrolase [Bacteroidota bacterium]